MQIKSINICRSPCLVLIYLPLPLTSEQFSEQVMAWRDLITSISEADILQQGWRGLLFSTLCCLNAWGKQGSWWDLCLWPASSGAESPGYFLAKQVGCLYQTGQVSLGNVAYVRWAMILQCLHCMQRVDQQPSSMLAVWPEMQVSSLARCDDCGEPRWCNSGVGDPN